MRLLSSFAFLLLLTTAAALNLPADAQEGIAVHFLDDDDNDVYIHETDFAQYNITLEERLPDPPLPTFPELPTSLAKRGLPSGDQINCEYNKPVDVTEFHNGMIYFADQLGCGVSIDTNHFARYKYVALIQWYGSTVLYTCNYSGAKRTYLGPTLVGYMVQVFTWCNKQSVAGWYFDNYRKVSWGVTSRNNGYCGPAQ
ncbi:hypothetical protein NQ176_g4454 [Zarea fungicola]|uniref:Uncharacterized protein n=1 Tax=Zarea fungicola TaxID=93591 RepID=A0ACC1NEM9_9HYPO|nr:hypothetical protein NQ176_g4454 [Lecanicillium fungicola]